MLRNPTTYRWLAIAWTLIILIGCTMPYPSIPTTVKEWNDKLLHGLIFLPFGAGWVMAGQRPGWVFLVGTAYGILIEVIQYVFPQLNRMAEGQDAFCDAIGALAGVVLGYALVLLLRIGQPSRI